MSAKRKALALFAAIMAMSVASCTALPGGARLEPSHPDTVIAGLLFGADTLEPVAGRRYIFNIHGMGATKQGYNKPMADRLTKAGYELQPGGAPWAPAPLGRTYGLRGEGFSCEGEAKNQPPCAYQTFGKYQVERYARDRGGKRDEVTVYTYFWQDDLWKLQKPYLQADMKEPLVRLGLGSGALKRQVMDQGFSDAVAYLGPAGEVVREGVRVVVCTMMRDAAQKPGAPVPPPDPKGGTSCLSDLGSDFRLGENVEFSFVSHSLGSRMLLDALSPYARPEDEISRVAANSALQTVADRTRTFFMAANQVPLLGIGRVEAVDPNKAIVEPQATERGFLDQRSQTNSEKTGGLAGGPRIPLDVVAFWDPGDLLGFKVNGGMASAARDDGGIRYFAVTHRNTPQWAWLFSWPTAAHDRELETPSAYKIIFCGATSQANGRLKARRCLEPGA